jgi:general L-amino acid transport system permease protein
MTTTTSHPSTPPSPIQTGPVAWLQKNLFSSWFNSLLTVGIVAVLLWLFLNFWRWATTTAKWDVIPKNLPLFMVGLYPADQRWRIWILFWLLCALGGLSWGVLARNVARLFGRGVLIGLGLICLVTVLAPVPVTTKLQTLAAIALTVAGAWIGQQTGRKVPALGKWISFAWFLAFLIALWLIGGGFGLKSVGTNSWGGLMLTLLMATVSIVLCFPLGIVLALGRRSDLPVIRWLSTLYIELIRGIPLIAILFMGQVMIPLFLPQGLRPDNILRAITGLTLFSAAYLAENVRGGLQAIPRGQAEASRALGLNPALTTGLIVLPQALKISIPAIVGQFISLFQDTTLLSLVSIVELLGISRSILANPEFLGRYREVFIFCGILFWIFCYAMSIGSRKLEERLNARPSTEPRPPH